MLKQFFSTSDSRALTLLRVVLGLSMAAHGAQKLLGWFGGYGFEGTIGYFSQALGIPAPLGTLVVIAEFFGGLGLAAGLFTRLSAAGITAVMAGAVYKVHLGNGFFMNWGGQQAGEGYEYHILVAAIGLVLVALGGGWASLDGAIARRLGDTSPLRARDGRPQEAGAR